MVARKRRTKKKARKLKKRVRKKTAKKLKRKTKLKISKKDYLRGLKEIKLLEQGFVPKKTKTGGEFKGKNKIVVA